MRLAIISAILVIAIGGFLIVQYTSQYSPSGPTISGTQDLVLNEQDLQQLGMTSEIDEHELEQLGLGNGNNCLTDEGHTNIIDSSLVQYTICAYLIPSLNDTQVIIELQEFANYEALDGTYQYDSSHLFGAKGLISENTYGDQSRFRANSEDDYGAEFNKPGAFYYHLWICKDLYLIHVTSGGTVEAEGQIEAIGQRILSKFG